MTGIIELSDGSVAQRTPILKKRSIGDYAAFGLVRTEKRPIYKQNAQGELQPEYKEDGRPKFELVLHGVSLGGTTMQAGLGDQISVPKKGDEVRFICRSGGYRQWIDAKKDLRRNIRVGDIVEYRVTEAKAYMSGKAKGSVMTTQEEVQACRERSPGQVIGFYGDITISASDVAGLTTICCDLYRDHEAMNQNNGPTIGGQNYSDMPDV